MVFEKKEEQKGRRPDFSSRDGVMIWKNLDKNGDEYLSVKIPLLNIQVNCFQLKTTEVEEEQVE